MINKQNEDTPFSSQEQENGVKDVAYMDVQLHLLIKDKDTGETLVNQRG